MDEIRALCATGMIGSGYLEASLQRGMAWEPHFIAADAGSTDGGPDALATGRCHFSRPAVKRDIRLMLQAAQAAGIPAIIGSAGSAGGDLNVQWTVEIVEEIAREEELRFKLAVIRSEQDREYLKSKLREGKIVPLKPAPHLDEAVIDRSIHIVGMMGHEPIAKALDDGAEVIVGGRASDTTLFAALPLARGFPEAPVWHAAKILECGAASVALRKSPDCMFATIREDHFIVEPPGEELWCTPQSVASHTLYENADPYHLYESSGMLDTTDSVYEAVSDRAVKVSNSRWVPAERYTVKLEGVELAGYQSIIIGAVQRPDHHRPARRLAGPNEGAHGPARPRRLRRPGNGPGLLDLLPRLRSQRSDGRHWSRSPLRRTRSASSSKSPLPTRTWPARLPRAPITWRCTSPYPSGTA